MMFVDASRTAGMKSQHCSEDCSSSKTRAKRGSTNEVTKLIASKTQGLPNAGTRTLLLRVLREILLRHPSFHCRGTGCVGGGGLTPAGGRRWQEPLQQDRMDSRRAAGVDDMRHVWSFHKQQYSVGFRPRECHPVAQLFCSSVGTYELHLTT